MTEAKNGFSALIDRVRAGESVLILLERMDALAAAWHETQPVASVRRAARRLLRVHALRAADALQLAAATIASEAHPGPLEIVPLDGRLIDAARRESFPVADLAAGGSPARACG